jgi:hypothetical protein
MAILKKTVFFVWLIIFTIWIWIYNLEGAKPLHVAAWAGFGVARLAAAGANPNARDLQGRTPLHAAVN